MSTKELWGLGFKEFNKMNTALLAKQVWRLMQSPNSYWASTVKAIYFPNTEFWQAKAQRGSSWLWKSLLQGKSLWKTSGRWQIGDGQNIHLTDDVWLSSGAEVTLPPTATTTNVGDLMNQNRE